MLDDQENADFKVGDTKSWRWICTREYNNTDHVAPKVQVQMSIILGGNCKMKTNSNTKGRDYKILNEFHTSFLQRKSCILESISSTKTNRT